MKAIATDVLVVGGGAGGVAAAIQASRHSVKTILATEFSWLGGMLTSAGVAAPDGNELAAWHTGLWGAYLKELQQRQQCLDNGWVSLFTYDPRYGAAIFADWVAQIPNLTWIKNSHPLSVTKHNNKITGVRFNNLFVEAKITIDATELGDLLALADVPYRWGWESWEEFQEPSLKKANRDFNLSTLVKKYPVQAPTWVFVLQDYQDKQSNTIKTLPSYKVTESQFQGAWDNYGETKFLNYGKLNDRLYMINWPLAGNDYGVNLDRLTASITSKKEWLTEAYEHSYNFATYLQSNLGKRYGLAHNIFPQQTNSLLPNLDTAFALHPYYRESRRLIGNTTITERHILPVNNGCVAPLPLNKMGQVDSIAIGNYANDHHYPDFDFKLQPKSIRWGGRWTGTPFTIPYNALVPKYTDGLLVSEKNISVSHIANGSTRLQPLVMNIGQAAGMAAALSIQHNCQPRELAIREIQEALITDKIAPSAVIPLFNLVPSNPQWLTWQRYYLEHPEAYPIDGNCYLKKSDRPTITTGNYYSGIVRVLSEQNYTITLTEPTERQRETWQLITIYPEVDRQFIELRSQQSVKLVGRLNGSGNWLLVEKILS